MIESVRPVSMNTSFGVLERRRSKTDWAGVHLGDAFRNNIDYMLRLAAQRSFYRVVRKVQKAVRAHAGCGEVASAEDTVKPQIGPFYTTYPSILAAHAAIGLTGYLELRTRVSGDFLKTSIGESLSLFLFNKEDGHVPEALVSLSAPVIGTVETRLILEELSRLLVGPFIEMYRLFCASQQTLLFVSVPEIVNCVVLYSDILPDLDRFPLHPVTRSILNDLSDCSTAFLEALPKTAGERFAGLGADWVKAILLRLMPYFLETEARTEAQMARSAPVAGKTIDACGTIAPAVPYVLDPACSATVISRTVLKDLISDKQPGEEDDKEIVATANRLVEALEKAGGQNVDYEDMRSDRVEQKLRDTGWQEGPLQGSPVEGHNVSIQLGEQPAEGEQFEQSLALSDDLAALDKLMEEARPVSRALRSILYPNITELPLIERFCTSGSLDPMRLSAAYYSDAVCRRTRIIKTADRKGAPVLLIACDGSGSLNTLQIRMLKILAAAWLESTARTRIQIIAGLYHSAKVREGLSGPMVEWIYHPRKTPALSRIDSIRALVGLPDSGTGAQSDALSLAFMLNEALSLARNSMVYMIVLSDCQWNRSFNGEMSGKEEVCSFFQDAYRRLEDRLHTTLVALGVANKTDFEDLLNRVIPVSAEELTRPADVAHKIGSYVASCLKERRGLLLGRAV